MLNQKDINNIRMCLKIVRACETEEKQTDIEETLINFDKHVKEYEAEFKKIKEENKIHRINDSYRNNVETITDEWGYTRTIVHEMGQ